MTENIAENVESVLEGYMTVKEAARYLNRSESLVRKLCSQGKIKGAIKIGTNWLIPKKAIVRYTPGPKGFAVMWARLKSEQMKLKGVMENEQ